MCVGGYNGRLSTVQSMSSVISNIINIIWLIWKKTIMFVFLYKVSLL